MTAQKEELVNGPQRVSYREKENITRKEDANKVKGKTIAIIIALFLVAANVVTACMYSIPYYKDNKDAIMALIGKKDEMVSKEIVAEGNTFRARQQGEARNQNTDTEEIEEGNMQNTLSSKDTYIWPDFAHASIFYMMADEDEEYIYFLYQPNMEWKNADVKSLTGSIYRMKKGDASSEQQLILSVNKNGIESIASFTLAGDYIYFSVMESPNNYSYYRIPKEGGTSEYLFEGGFSYLDADYGVVFCNFFETGEIGSYDESDQSFLLMSQIDWLGGFDAMAGAHQSFSVYAPFSVLDGKMYLGGEVDSISYYGY